MLNIHHLELFYYVAKHGGITEAVRNIPYGIQQPAVSAQILQLEDAFGVTLFNRRPFALTPAGEKVYRFIRPFFEGLPAMEDEVRGDVHHLRFGGSAVVLRDHLPEIAQGLRKRFPKLRLTLREGHRPQLESWLLNQELDLVTTLLDSKPVAGIHSLPLLKLPLMLLVQKRSEIRSAGDLWSQDKIEDALISLPPYETIPRCFQQGLHKRGIDWLPRIEVSSLTLIENYVERGYGIGVYVAIPKYNLPANIRALPLPDFPTVTAGVLWQGKLTAVSQAFVEELQKRAKQLLG